MINIDLVTLLHEYFHYANNQADIEKKTKIICNKFSIPEKDFSRSILECI